jgi:hypothetical protein
VPLVFTQSLQPAYHRKLRMRMPSSRSAPLAITLIFSSSMAFAQAGSTGGVIGKQGKSISGAEESVEPLRIIRKREPRRSSSSETAKPKSRETSSPCRQLTGIWFWSTGGQTTFKADGTLAKGQLTGKWSCTNGQVEIVWSHGFVDKLALSPGDGKLRGKNNLGYGVSGSRKDVN